ncbi:DUF3667 domain-containing protein [Flavivirga spongiicola]|uniref:DUF3667 domain-containing protein n=1 Tax=Flavivirga spongiicola TaxID=421621 RepID=A0ABU7XXB2_9FLAO|nr:DUF3667 domain-containing protein [Flavivirga sp. MEBiC05379]MDO5980441.1 DUF3667 domain-containing protein [Flavivirga sp. MEBiC05379]
MKTELETCKNCENQFEETFKFCPHCGQQTKEDLTVGVLFYNTISNYFSFDARFFKSFLPLLFKPGYLAKKFIEGKRLLYLHPAQLYLFVSVVFFFLLTTVVVRDQVQDLDTAFKKTRDTPIISDNTVAKAQQALDSVKLDSILLPLKEKGIPGMKAEQVKALDSLIKASNKDTVAETLTFDFDQKKVDSLIAIDASDTEIYSAMGVSDDAGYLTKKFYTQVLKFYKQRNGGQILQAIYDTIPISLFVLLPIFAFILKLLFFKRGHYAHHLVFSFYFFSFLFTVFSLILIVNNFFEVPNWIDWLLVVSTFFYLFVAIKRFYNHGWFLSFIKTGISSFVYLMFVIPIAIIIVGLIGFLFY